MRRLCGGLLLVLCASLGSAAVYGHARLDGARPSARATPAASSGAWAADHVLVAARSPEVLSAVARDAGVSVLRAPGPAGYGALGVPHGVDARSFAARLGADPRVAIACPDGITRGVGGAGRFAGGRRARWHLRAANAPDSGDAHGIVVAVLDTGVAYEDRVERGRAWRRAPSLAGVPFVAPWDFINLDAHPNDDHQHGTHLASLVAASGPYPGIAAGVSLMPVKVLDADNVGTELALVDGIVHAVKNGAHVINMSLSFGRGYVPSRALTDALERASDAGSVLVAAAGNDGGPYVSQPAASPLVIAVGANRPEGIDRYGAAPYSNASPRVDLMAPGGSVDRDRDQDGLLDGVIGETIALQDPSRTGYWLYAGTSQATALVSGAAARLLAQGVPAGAVRAILQRSAAPESYIRRPWADGRGPGRLDVAAAMTLAAEPGSRRVRDLSAAVLAWLRPVPGGRAPSVRVVVFDEAMAPVPGAEVIGRFSGAEEETFVCVTDASGACTQQGLPVPEDLEAAWSISADDVVVDGAAHHPRTAIFVGDGLQAVAAGLEERSTLDGAVLAWRWRAQTHPQLGRLEDAILVGNHGRARATSPLVLLATPGALGATEVLEAGTLRIDGRSMGAGAGGAAIGAQAPISARLSVRAHAAPRCDAGPRAYEVLRFAGADLTAVLLDATGLVDALGLGAAGLFGGIAPVPPPYEGHPVPLSRIDACDIPGFADTPVGRALGRGGWTARGGEPAASSLASLAMGDAEATPRASVRPRGGVPRHGE